MDGSYSSLLENAFSAEGGDVGIKQEGNDVRSVGTSVEIDLDDYEGDAVGIDFIENAIKSKGWTKLGLSYTTEAGVHTHSPNTIVFMDKNEQIDGVGNMVVNGEFLPDTIVAMMRKAKIKVITPRTVLLEIQKDLIYYIVNDDGEDHLYRFMKGEGALVAKTPLELGDVIAELRNRQTTS